MSQRELASKVEISPASLSAYEQKGKYPTLDVAVRLAEVLGVSLDWLIAREEKNRIKGIPDIFRIFLEISLTPAKVSFRVEGDVAYIGITDKGLTRVLQEWEDMTKLFNAGTINFELYYLWLSKKLEDLDQHYDGFTELKEPEDDEPPF